MGSKVADGLSALAIEKLNAGNTSAATGLFRQAVGLDPFNAPANLNLAQAARARGDAKAARKMVRNALKQNGKNPDAYAVLARIYFDMGRFELSKLVCQSGLELGTKSPRLHNTLGLIYLREDDQRRAIRAFASAIKADKSFVPSKLNLGALVLSYKDFKLAYAQFK
jgi:Tfp pilus assembly protein PilF